MNQEDYFFCYSTNLLEFLRVEKAQKYICTALNDKTMNRFWLFEKTQEFEKLLIEYNSIGRKLKVNNY